MRHHPYGRVQVKHDAHKIAEAVHVGEINEVVVPLVLRDTIQRGSGLLPCYNPWLHTAGMSYYNMKIKQLRKM